MGNNVPDQCLRGWNALSTKRLTTETDLLASFPMNGKSNTTKRGETITRTTATTTTSKAEQEAQTLLAQYVDALKMRNQGTSLLLEGSNHASYALQCLSKYFRRFPAIKAKAKAETAKRLEDAVDYLDEGVSAEMLDTANGCVALASHFECMAIV